MATVLLADDSIAVRKVAERHLTEAGLAVTLAASGEEAIALLAGERPDLIVCDVIMPDKSGYDVCTYTRSQESLAGTPVLLISGIVNDNVTRQAKTCGANGVLKKPFHGTSLKDAVLDLLAKAPQARPADSAAAVAGTAPAELPASGNNRVDTLVAQIEELKGAFAREQERANELTRQFADQSQMQERITELEASLSSERHTAAQLNEQAGEAAKNVQRIQELEALLAKECEQNADLTQRLTEAEEAVATATAREEEITQKLTRIADLSK